MIKERERSRLPFTLYHFSTMPISHTKSSKPDTSIRYVNGPWPVRINNKLGGAARDENTLLLPGSFETVILGYRTLLGLLPPLSTYDAFINALKDPERMPAPGRLSAQEQLFHFAAQRLKPYVFLTHVPLPSSLNAIQPHLKDYWPQGVVTGSYFTSIGLTGGKNSLLGDLGLIPLLETSGRNLVDVVTTVDFIKKEGNNRSYFINEFTYYPPDPEQDKEAYEHTQACKKFIEKWIKENPGATDFPLPPDQLMFDISPKALLNRDEEFQQAARLILTAQAHAVFPAEDIPTLDIPSIVKELVATPELMAISSTETEQAIQTIEVKPIE